MQIEENSATKIISSMANIDKDYIKQISVDYSDIRVIGNEKAFNDIFCFMKSFLRNIQKKPVDLQLEAKKLNLIVLTNNLSMSHLYNRLFFNWLNINHNRLTFNSKKIFEYSQVMTVYLMILIRSYYFEHEIRFFYDTICANKINLYDLGCVSYFLHEKKHFNVFLIDYDEEDEFNHLESMMQLL